MSSLVFNLFKDRNVSSVCQVPSVCNYYLRKYLYILRLSSGKFFLVSFKETPLPDSTLITQLLHLCLFFLLESSVSFVGKVSAHRIVSNRIISLNVLMWPERQVFCFPSHDLTIPLSDLTIRPWWREVPEHPVQSKTRHRIPVFFRSVTLSNTTKVTPLDPLRNPCRKFSGDGVRSVTIESGLTILTSTFHLPWLSLKS